MSDNPFASRNPESADPRSAKRPKVPGGLTALLIICLVLGILGLLGSCYGVGAIVFQTQLQEFQLKNQPAAQQEVQKKINQLQDKFLIPNAIIAGLGLIIAGSLTVGAIGAMNRRAWGRSILLTTFIGAILLNIVRTTSASIMMVSTSKLTEEMLKASLPQENPAVNPQGIETASTVVGIIFYGVIAMMVAWMLLLIGFYIWGWIYLRKDHIKSYFGVA